MIAKSISRKILFGFFLFGLLMGLVFPVYAEFFTTYTEGLEIYFKLGCIMAGLMVGFFNYYLARLIVLKPVLHVISEIEKISGNENDLTQKVQFESKDELGKIKEFINLFITKLQGIIINLISTSHRLVSSSKELSDTSESIFRSTAELEKKTVHAATATGALSSNINTISQAIEQTNSSISHISDASEQMETTIARIAKDMDTTQSASISAVNRVKSSVDKILEFESLANEISNIVETINIISEQTKLLSLNATIEAARAGEAGKGFAVVAGEVKNLASQSRTSAEEIGKLITRVQDSIRLTVEDFNDINKTISKVSTSVTTISSSLDVEKNSISEVAANITQVSKHIDDISTSIQYTRKVVQEVSAETIKVEHLGKTIKAFTDTFQVNSTNLTKMSSAFDEVVSKFIT